MQGSAGLQFYVLGPLEVRDDDRRLPLGGFQQRLLLAALLVQANTVISADKLIDILWTEGLPEDAPATLAKSMYRLRAAFGPAGAANVLITRSPGYLVSVTNGQLDSARFGSLLSDAHAVLDSDPAQALRRLDDALRLWRGPALAEFTDHEFARPEILRLEGLRAVAMEHRADALLALGRHEELIPELQAAAVEFPLRERPRAQLMLSLYRCGRQADALSAYRTFRKYLLDEVGLEPSSSLRRLEQEILEQRADSGPVHARRTDARPASRTRGTDPVPVSEDRFIGRSRDLNWLEVLFGRAVAGERAVVGLLSGGEGTGKTSLVKTFGRLVHARGADVLFARCDRAVGATEAVLEALGAPMSIAAGIESTAEARLDALDESLATICSGAPVLLVIDDLDADRDDDCAVLARLASMRPAGPICVIGTCRDRAEELAAGSGPSLQLRTLSGLDRADVAEILDSFSGAVRSPGLVDSIWVETAGLPALVVSVARRLRDLDVAARADRALARAEGAREDWAAVRTEVALGVLARGQLLPRHPDPAADLGLCPYKGLAAFGVADAALFSGREQLVASLVARLATDRFLAVVGPSGSGKSSLVAAGLVPALAYGGLPGSERWVCRIIRPGAQPMKALASAVAPLLSQPVPVVQSRLELEPGELDGVAGEITAAHGSGERLVLVVDQFEEVFTACADAGARRHFIRALVESPSSPDSRLVVAIAMRADYYGACAEHPELARLLGQGQVLVAAMTDSELRRAIIDPARHSSLAVEEGLADAIVAEAAGEPGALPLVSTALLQTWVHRAHGTLTLAGYREAGGVRGAVGQLADEVYDALQPTDQAVARRVFLRLADPGGTRSDVRRRARREELASTDAERQVLEQLIDRRLLTATEDTVEVAHEALLREWPRLRGWLEQDREGRQLHRQLTQAAEAWQVDLRDESGLYRGVRLHAALDWTENHQGDANPLERQFLDASRQMQERNIRLARRSARRLRLLAAGLAALLVVALVAGALAVLQRSEARRAATLAQSRALQAETSRLGALARTLPNDQRDLALLLGIEGFRLLPSDETVGDLQAALVQTPPSLDRIISYPSQTDEPQLDRGGRLLAVPDELGVTVYDVNTGQLVRSLKWPQPRRFAAFSGDDSRIAAGGSDGQVAIWNTSTGRLYGQPINAGPGIAGALFDPTNPNRVYVFTEGGELTSWQLVDGQSPRQVGPTRYFDGGDSAFGGNEDSSATITPDGQLIAAGAGSVDSFGVSTVWNLETGKERLLHGALGQFGADNTTLPVGIGNETVLFNARTDQEEAEVPNPGGAQPGAVLSPDGQRVAVTVQEKGPYEVAVYDVHTGQQVGAPLQLANNGAFPVGFLPDGRLLTTGSAEAGIWTLGRTLPPLAVPLPASGDYDATVFMPAGHEVVTEGTTDGALLRHDAQTGQTLGPLLAGQVQAPITPSPDGKLIAGPSSDRDEIGIWSMSTGKLLTLLPKVSGTAELAWSPSGRQLASDYGPSVQIWDVSNPSQPILTASVLKTDGVPRPDYLLFSPDGRQILTAGSDDNRLTMINVERQRVQWTTPIADRTLSQVAFSPDGRTVALNAGDAGTGHLTLYSSATGKPRQSTSIQGFGGVGYLHGGQWLVITYGQSAPAAQLYDATTLQPIGVPFPTLGPNGVPLATNPAGTQFSEAEQDTPLLWNTDPSEWQTIACNIAGRNLTRAEWREYIPSRSYQSTCSQWPRGR